MNILVIDDLRRVILNYIAPCLFYICNFILQPLTARAFPSTVISPIPTNSPISLVSVSPSTISSKMQPLQSTTACQQDTNRSTTTIQPAVTIIKTEIGQKPSLTALDVLNDTIVKSFDTHNTDAVVDLKRQNAINDQDEAPLNLMKSDSVKEMQKNRNPPNNLIIQVGNNTIAPVNPISLAQADIKPIADFTPNSRLTNQASHDSVLVKCEPDFSVVECRSPSARNFCMGRVPIGQDSATLPNPSSDINLENGRNMCENNHFNQAYLRDDNENMKMMSMNTRVVVNDSPIDPKTTSSFINSNKNQLSQSPKGNH